MGPLAVDHLRETDVAELARIHIEAFPGFFLSSLGEPFLRQFYAGFLGDTEVVAVVLRDTSDGRPLGAAVGPLAPAGFFSRLVRRRAVHFAAAAATAAVRSPRSIPRLLRGVRYRGQGGAEAPGALLSSICVTPVARGTGGGSTLLRAWQTEVANRGVSSAHLTTDAEGNEDVNAFYERHGWPVSDTYTTPEGRVMHLRVRHDLR